MFWKVIKVDAEYRVQTWKNHLIHDPFPQRLSFVKSLCYLQIFFINFFIHDFHLDIERKEVNHQLCQSKTTAVNLVKIFAVQDRIMQVPRPGNKSKFYKIQHQILDWISVLSTCCCLSSLWFDNLFWLIPGQWSESSQ